jgi:threonine synthase
MKFYSTNNKNHKVSLKDAVIRGLAPDSGLYMPETIPALPHEFLQTLSSRSFQDISFEVARTLLQGELSEADLKKIIAHTIQFDAPLVPIEKDIFSLELFHGPTLAFKDFGARFMSQLLAHFAKEQEKEIVILVATSGDTGSAVANGFLGVKGTRVIVLYPAGKVSEIQEKQFTTLGRNVTALEVNGTFDDCQRLVKEAFQDETLRSDLFLTSANSINIARLIPQSFYYFYAFGQIKEKNKPVVFSVPSGNFGNLTAGLIAKRMGLPINKFIVATNINDVVPEYLRTKIFQPRSSVQTISNAMDVGNPSNFARMVDLYDNDFEALSKDIKGYAFTDNETAQAMKAIFESSSYVLDPHGAIGYAGLKKYLSDNSRSSTGVFLETAHPGKFLEVVEGALGQKILLPSSLSNFLNGKKITIPVSTDFSEFKKVLRRL